MNKTLVNQFTQRALFLNRDGAINVNHCYVYRPENFNFKDEFTMARAAYALHYKLVLRTIRQASDQGITRRNNFTS